jgi:hypothetical protein
MAHEEGALLMELLLKNLEIEQIEFKDGIGEFVG